MLTIRGIITYASKATQLNQPKPQQTRLERLQTKREQWRAEGLCMQHGNERPCQKCADGTRKWREAKKDKDRKAR